MEVKCPILLQKAGADKASEIEQFILAVKHILEGKLDEFCLNPAVETSQFDLNFSTFPVLSELSLTYDCNLRCKFCYAGCNCTSNPAGSGEELTLKGFKTIIDKIYKEGKSPIHKPLQEVNLLTPRHSGFLYCIRQIAWYACESDTNGTQVDQSLPQVKIAGVDLAQVSIEGVTSEIHDSIVQSKGHLLEVPTLFAYSRISVFMCIQTLR
jgi:hypothetical protein